jgi:uncharacterized membrane protein
MNKITTIVFVVLFFCFSTTRIVAQQFPAPVKQSFYKATVTTITREGTKDFGGIKNIFQDITIQFLEGPEKGKTVTVEHGGVFTITKEQKVQQGDTVIVSATKQLNKTIYTVVDTYRLDTLLWLVIGFFVVVFAIARRKGLGAFIGMIISLAVIFFFIVPQIINGANPLFISIIGSLFIMVTTIYLAHGFSQQTNVAVLATFMSLIITGALSILFVKIAHLSGMGSEDAVTLFQGFQGKINSQGLLLGSIIIGALGVLDDVTTTQTTTIYELAEANEKYTIEHLFHKGMIIGREHIASLVNTLVLAYAGASIGVFIFLWLGMQNNTQPLWVMLNSEIITEEVVRTLAGSLSLILAVPITTLLAAFFSKYSLKVK